MGVKVANSGSFRKGNPGRPPGIANQPDPVKQFFKRHINSIDAIFDEAGIQALWNDIQRLPLRDKVNAQLTLLEYVKPKLSRLEVYNDNEVKVISIFGKELPSPIHDEEIITDDTQLSKDGQRDCAT